MSSEPTLYPRRRSRWAPGQGAGLGGPTRVAATVGMRSGRCGPDQRRTRTSSGAGHRHRRRRPAVTRSPGYCSARPPAGAWSTAPVRARAPSVDARRGPQEAVLAARAAGHHPTPAADTAPSVAGPTAPEEGCDRRQALLRSRAKRNGLSGAPPRAPPPTGSSSSAARRSEGGSRDGTARVASRGRTRTTPAAGQGRRGRQSHRSN